MSWITSEILIQLALGVGSNVLTNQLLRFWKGFASGGNAAIRLVALTVWSGALLCVVWLAAWLISWHIESRAFGQPQIFAVESDPTPKDMAEGVRSFEVLFERFAADSSKPTGPYEGAKGKLRIKKDVVFTPLTRASTPRSIQIESIKRLEFKRQFTDKPVSHELWGVANVTTQNSNSKGTYPEVAVYQVNVGALSVDPKELPSFADMSEQFNVSFQRGARINGVAPVEGEGDSHYLILLGYDGALYLTDTTTASRALDTIGSHKQLPECCTIRRMGTADENRVGLGWQSLLVTKAVAGTRECGDSSCVRETVLVAANGLKSTRSQITVHVRKTSSTANEVVPTVHSETILYPQNVFLKWPEGLTEFTADNQEWRAQVDGATGEFDMWTLGDQPHKVVGHPERPANLPEYYLEGIAISIPNGQDDGLCILTDRTGTLHVARIEPKRLLDDDSAADRLDWTRLDYLKGSLEHCQSVCWDVAHNEGAWVAAEDRFLFVSRTLFSRSFFLWRKIRDTLGFTVFFVPGVVVQWLIRTRRRRGQGAGVAGGTM